MRYRLYIVFLMVLSGSVFAQQRPGKVENLRMAFIIRQVGFTEAESEKFWPVYNEYHDKLRMARRDLRQNHMRYKESMSEEEVRTLAASEMELRAAEAEIHRRYSSRIVAIIGDRKYMRLRLAEEQFRRQMLQKLRDRDE